MYIVIYIYMHISYVSMPAIEPSYIYKYKYISIYIYIIDVSRTSPCPQSSPARRRSGCI